MGDAPWLLVQRRDADPDDRERADALAVRLGAAIVRTADADGLDDVLRGLDGRDLVVCGGDGSIHLAVNRLWALDMLGATRFGVLPAGTGNDLARTLGLPHDPAALATVLETEHLRTLDLLDLGRYGVAVNALHAGVGVDAAERSAGLPDELGALAYPLGALLAGIDTDGFEGAVEVDGSRLVSPHRAILMVVVLNGATIGGGHVLAPRAVPDDGRLDVVVTTATSLAARGAFGAAIAQGSHLERDDVASAQGTQVTIRGRGVAYNVDGEVWEHAVDVLEVRLAPSQLRLFAPRHGPERTHGHLQAR